MDNNTQDNEIDRELEAEMAREMEAEMAREAEQQASLADFEELARATGVAPEGAAGAAPGERPITALYELMLPITIELGRTRMSVQEVLQLSRGSVVELDRLAGEPVDIFVGDRRFAEGEVVVLGENFGVRITRLLPPSGAAEAA